MNDGNKSRPAEKVKEVFNNPLFLAVLVASAFGRAEGKGSDFIVHALGLVLAHGFICIIALGLFFIFTERN